MVDLSAERSEARKLTQTLGRQSRPDLGISRTARVSRASTTPASSRHPHNSCLVPTRNDWDHHFSNLNFLNKVVKVNNIQCNCYPPEVSVLPIIINDPTGL